MSVKAISALNFNDTNQYLPQLSQLMVATRVKYENIFVPFPYFPLN